MTATMIIAAAAVVVSAAGVAITLINAWAQAEKQVGDLYDQMVNYRADHPEVMHLSRKWGPGCFEEVYGQETEEDKQWVVYYSYVELCLGYCSIVLSSRRRLPPGSFRGHHGPLVKLTLTEHNPIVEQLLTEPCLSDLVRGFRKELAEEQWDWREEHRKLLT